MLTIHICRYMKRKRGEAAGDDDDDDDDTSNPNSDKRVKLGDSA